MATTCVNGIDRRSTLRVLTMPVLQTTWDNGNGRRGIPRARGTPYRTATANDNGKCL